MSLTTGLVSYWKLDESSGNASDSVGGNTLTVRNTVSYVSAKINNGADMSSTWNNNNALERTTGLGVDLSGAFSFSLWVKLNSEIPSGTNHFLNWRSTTGTTRYFIYKYDYNGGTRRIALDASGTAINYNVTLGTSFHHHVVTCSAAGAVTIYIDGVSVATGTRGTGTSTDVFSLGQSNDQTNTGTAGVFDEVGAWSRDITSTEVSQLYNSGAGLQYPFGVAPAFDNATRGDNGGSTSSLTFSHTITGTNPILFVGFMGGLTDKVSSVTYNGVAMTQVGKQAGDGTSLRYNYLYMLMAPATGANNVVITLTSTDAIVANAVSYTGANQSSQPDASGTATNSSVTTISKTLTSIANNCWSVAWINNQTASFGSYTGTPRGTADSRAFIDSNGPITPAGSTTLTGNWTGSGKGSICMATFSPSSGVISTTGAALLAAFVS